MNVLVVVDAQNDFITGTLGTPEAQSIIPRIVEKIRAWNGVVFATQDTHASDYLSTQEGKRLPVPHCLRGTWGWKIHPDIDRELEPLWRYKLTKSTFASYELAEEIDSYQALGAFYDNWGGTDELCIQMVGFCTDICVISNALLLKARYPEAIITVDASCCAGTTPEAHEKALDIMQNCQIDVINRGYDYARML